MRTKNATVEISLKCDPMLHMANSKRLVEVFRISRANLYKVVNLHATSLSAKQENASKTTQLFYHTCRSWTTSIGVVSSWITCQHSVPSAGTNLFEKLHALSEGKFLFIYKLNILHNIHKAWVNVGAWILLSMTTQQILGRSK